MHLSPYSNRHVIKSFSNNDIISAAFLVAAEEVAAKITCMNISFLVYSNMQKALKLLKTEL